MELLTVGALKQGFRQEGIAKTMFSQKSFTDDLRVDSVCFWEALGAGFLSFCAMETGLKLQCFSRSPWGSWMTPGNKVTDGSVVIMLVWVRSNNLSITSWVITLA